MIYNIHKNSNYLLLITCVVQNFLPRLKNPIAMQIAPIEI